jgi:hypothetical protein
VAVAYDAASRSTTGFDNNTVSWTHTPVGTPKGVTVIVAIEGASDQIASVTYGGVAMTRKRTAHRTTAEAGGVFGYFLGSGIPTGPQTVQVTTSPGTGTNDWAAHCVTWTAATPTTTGDVGNAATSAATTNPSLSIAGITPTAGIHYGLWTGLATPPTSAQSGSTHRFANDFGADGFSSNTKVTGLTSTTMGYTASSDVYAHLAIVVQEGAAATPSGAFATASTEAVSGVTGARTSSGTVAAASTGTVAMVGGRASESTVAASSTETAGWVGESPEVVPNEGTFAVASTETADATGARTSSGTSAAPSDESVGWAGAVDSEGASAATSTETVASTGARDSVGTVSVADETTVEATGAVDVTAAFAVDDTVDIPWTGTAPEVGPPGEGTFATDATADVAATGARGSSGSSTAPDSVSVAWGGAAPVPGAPGAGTFPVDDTISTSATGARPSGGSAAVTFADLVEWSAERSVVGSYTVDDAVTVAWVGPPNTRFLAVTLSDSNVTGLEIQSYGGEVRISARKETAARLMDVSPVAVDLTSERNP